MSKLIRFDEDHFGYLMDVHLTHEEADTMVRQFSNAYPGKRLIVMQADEFIDLTGQYEVVPIRGEVTYTVTIAGESDDAQPEPTPLT